MAENNSTGPTDPFSAMWAEWIKHMAPAGISPPAATKETLDHLRQAFFDMLAGQADQFMRSEAFLKSMKQATDNAVAWQKTLNEAMQRGLAAAQVPSRVDAEHIVALVRGMEDRLVDKLDDLKARVDSLEQAAAKS